MRTPSNGRLLWAVLSTGALQLGVALPAAAQANAGDPSRRIFSEGAAPLPACALCHTLKAAGAKGAIGPDLDDLKPDAGRIERVLRSGMGPMPAYKSLSDAQIAQLAKWVERGAK